MTTNNKQPIRPTRTDADTSDVRPTRVGLFSARNVQTVEGLDPAYKYRWVNAAVKGRVERFQAAWYEVVVDDKKVGDERINQADPIAGAVTLNSGGDLMVLMRIRKEYAEEDARQYNAQVDKTEEGMRKSIGSTPNSQGQYGNVDIYTK